MLPPTHKHRLNRVTNATCQYLTRVVVTPAIPYIVAAARLLVLSGWREKEILHLPWDLPR